MLKRDDEELLTSLAARAREGDRRAYGRLFRLCYRSIYDYIIRRVGNQADAEDLTMNVFVRGLESIGAYEERGCSIKAWLYRIAHNIVVDHYRVSRDLVDLERVSSTIYVSGEMEEALSSKVELEKLYREVMKLPPAQSEVMVLRFIKDLSVAETGAALNKKEVTVRALQFKGIKNLRERLLGGERDVQEGPGELTEMG